MIARAAFLLLLSAVPAAAGSCDALAARVVRVTGASVAGRAGSGAVFRAADAERMTLDCARPRIVVAAIEREPRPRFFALVGQAAEALSQSRGSPLRAAEAEVLALDLHQASLLREAPAEGRAGPLAIRCETGPRADTYADATTLCMLAPALSRTARRR